MSSLSTKDGAHFSNPFGGRHATDALPGTSARATPDGGNPVMAPHEIGQYRPGAGVAQPSLGDIAGMLRGGAGRPDLDVRDDAAVQQPGADRR